MVNLDKNWLINGLIDFEYKKYVLLAYLKSVKKQFDESKLYPYLSDLVFHYRNLQTVKKKKALLYEHFPKQLSKADFNKLKLNYERIVKDDGIMKEIEDILAFSIPQMMRLMIEGKNIHEFIESHVAIETVGLEPIYKKEGYFFIEQDNASRLHIFRYQMSLFEKAEEKYQGIHTEYLSAEKLTIAHTIRQIKLNLIKKYENLPNPATYLFRVKAKFPFEESLVPIAKRLLMKQLALAA